MKVWIPLNLGQAGDVKLDQDFLGNWVAAYGTQEDSKRSNLCNNNGNRMINNIDSKEPCFL